MKNHVADLCLVQNTSVLLTDSSLKSLNKTFCLNQYQGSLCYLHDCKQYSKTLQALLQTLCVT